LLGAIRQAVVGSMHMLSLEKKGKWEGIVRETAF
jgi:hypothetical protein